MHNIVFSMCVFVRSFENNLSTYRLLSYRKADSELPNVRTERLNTKTLCCSLISQSDD